MLDLVVRRRKDVGGVDGCTRWMKRRCRESDGADGDTLASSREIEFDLWFGALIECQPYR